MGFEGTDWNFVIEVSAIKSQVRSVGESDAIHVISSDIDISNILYYSKKMSIQQQFPFLF